MDAMDTYRVSASALIFDQDHVLLNTCKNPDGSTFLLGPGGGIKAGEDVAEALRREVQEETGLLVTKQKLLFIEDLLFTNRRILKIWFLCDIAGGSLVPKPQDSPEGIVAVDWYTKEQLVSKTVYPSLLLGHEWSEFFSEAWQARWLPLHNVAREI